MKTMDKGVFKAGLVLVILFTIGGICHAGDRKGLKGWGIDEPYNRLYIADDLERLKDAIVTDVKEVVPMPGMSPGVALVIKEGKDTEEILVHLCPLAYKKPRQIGIKKGEEIDLRGVFVEIDGQEVILAAKIKRKSGKNFKIRLTSDGTPFWAMTPAQLQKELADQ